MGELIPKPLSGMSNDEIDRASNDLALLLEDQGNVESLKQRHLVGVVERHSDYNPRTLREARAKMQASSEQIVNSIGAFALIDTNSNRTLGMATYQVGLPLWEQRVPLPAKFTRNPLLGKPVNLSESMANVAAWVSVDTSIYDELVSAYEMLRQEAPHLAWTIEPERSPSYIDRAIMEAGFAMFSLEPARFDDFEEGSRAAPLSNLYTS